MKIETERIRQYLKDHEKEMLEDLSSLVRINSERMEAEEGMPFGKGAVQALREAEKLIGSHGFSVTNHDNYVITAELNEKEHALDILGHLDVVPPGEGWTITEPFEPKVQDGKIFGRGMADDKGPVIAALYAMKAIQELQIPMKTGVRLILGTDEECGSGDIEYYYKNNQPAAMTLSPDGEFPVVNIEKGGFAGEFTAEFEEDSTLPRVASIDAGVKFNVVPGKAGAVVEGLTKEEILPYAGKAEKDTGVVFSIAEQEGSGAVHIAAEGVGGHASVPENAINALTALLQLLRALPLADTKPNRLVGAVSRMLPHRDYYGEALGIRLEDPESGKTTVSFNIMHMDGKKLYGCFDSRASIAANEENTIEPVRKVFIENGLTPGDLSMYAPHYVSSNSELVQQLLASYKEVTGIDAKPLAIGGGSYVHNIPGGVVFGCADLEVDNHMHGADEFMSIEQLLLSAELYVNAIVRLCGES